MFNVRQVGLALAVLAAQIPALAQSVVSTHSGVVYFFTGSVFIGNERLEQKFGRFPDIGEGRELRTEQGRAEVLLTPGVILRVAENSSIRLLSSQLADTQVELLSGSTILETNDRAKGTAVTLALKNWQVTVPQEGVYRIDCVPSQIKVYKGEAEVATRGEKGTVTVHEGEVLPLAAVLLTDRAIAAEGDSFKTWAMNRSQAIAADNATAADIIDDPSQFGGDALAMGGFTYFPPGGMSSTGVNNPYGVSFWSSYQTMLNSIYFPPYVSYSAWPVGTGWPNRSGIVRGVGTGWIGGIGTNRLGYHPNPSPLHQGPVVLPLHPGSYARPGYTPSPRVPVPTQRTYTYGSVPHPVSPAVPHPGPPAVSHPAPAHR
jgi:hypothetical protein